MSLVEIEGNHNCSVNNISLLKTLLGRLYETRAMHSCKVCLVRRLYGQHATIMPVEWEWVWIIKRASGQCMRALMVQQLKTRTCWLTIMEKGAQSVVKETVQNCCSWWGACYYCARCWLKDMQLAVFIFHFHTWLVQPSWFLLILYLRGRACMQRLPTALSPPVSMQ